MKTTKVAVVTKYSKVLLPLFEFCCVCSILLVLRALFSFGVYIIIITINPLV